MSRIQSARRNPKFSKPTLSTNTENLYEINAELHFITPMFGGGVKLNADAPHQKEYDAVTPVRGASLRGQLRTWWRRICDPALDPDILRAREALLWGWASTKEKPAKGLVSLAIEQAFHAEQVAVYKSDKPKEPIQGFGDPLAYGAFPLQSPANASQAGTLTRLKGDFCVRVTLADVRSNDNGNSHKREGGNEYRRRAEEAWSQKGDDLQNTMWDEVERAWLAFATFGGLGGRTRRGFGAVMQVNPLSLDDVLQRLGWADRVARFKVNGDAEEAQKKALGKLQRFRQGIEVGRNRQDHQRRPGRSRWPEPDELRRITDKHAKFSDRNHAPVHKVHKFPRAAFGMPIIFHFKDTKEGDPEDRTLSPLQANRLASPLVIRPVRDETGIYAVALKLPGEAATNTVLEKLKVSGKGKQDTNVCGKITQQEQADIKPLKEYRGAPEEGLNAVLNPFLRFFAN